MLARFRSWDAISQVAALLCVANTLVLILDGGQGAEPLENVAWWRWLFMPLAFLLLVPLLSAPQLGMLLLIRHSSSTVIRLIFLCGSIAMVGLYYLFLQNADLASNSTAALSAFFYPWFLAGVSAATGATLLWLHRRLSLNRSDHRGR